MRTLFKALIFLLVLIVIVVAGTWIANNGGQVNMTWGPYEMRTTVARLALLTALAFLVLLIVVGLINLVLRGPGRLKHHMRERRQEKGYEQLTRGLVAVAAGDAQEARRKARKADQLLGHPPLTMLLVAQAAQLDGDREAARAQFTEMLDHPETEFLGLRGLMVEALRQGDEAAARGFAERAHALRPDAAWAADALFALQGRTGDWLAAQKTLDQAKDRRAIDAAGSRRRRGVVLTERGREALARLERDSALQLAREAHGDAPDLVAATALLAQLLIEQEKLKPAAKVIEKSWAATPHPELAELYRRSGRDDGVERYKRMGKLVDLAPQSPESHLAAARAALDAKLTGEARRHLEAVAAAPLDHRTARLWAELEEADGHPERAREWVARAAEAEGDPVWHCGQCLHVAPRWQAICVQCGAFDAIGWGRPGAQEIEPGMRILPLPSLLAGAT